MRRYLQAFFRHPILLSAPIIIALVVGIGYEAKQPRKWVAWATVWCDSPVPNDFRIPASPFSYLRLRRTGYSDDDLAAWSRRIGSALAEGSDVYCYFKHEEKGAGPILAERLAALLSG